MPLRCFGSPLKKRPAAFSSGRGTYCRSALRVNSLRRLVFSCLAWCRLRDLSASAGGGFYHRRVSSQLHFVDHLFLISFAASVGGPTAIAVSPVLPRGAASIAASGWSQLNFVGSVLLHSPFPPPARSHRFVGARRLSPLSLESTLLHRLRISSFPARVSRRHCGFAFPVEGRGFYHHRVSSQQASPRGFFQTAREEIRTSTAPRATSHGRRRSLVGG